MARYIDADKLKPDTKTFTSAYSEELIEVYSQEAIDNAPTADVAPVVHGHWIICSDGYYPYCSECCDEPKNGVMTKYCSNCGAKMDGKDGEHNA